MQLRRKSNKLLSLLAGVCLVVGTALGIGIGGNFVNSPNCSLKVYRKPTGSRDTLVTKTDGVYGAWVIGTENFRPPADTGETIYVSGGWNLGGESKTWEVLTTSPGPYLDLVLDKRTACIRNVNDSSHVSGNLSLAYNLEGFEAETTEIDTHFTGHYRYDAHPGLNKSQAVHGAQAHFKFFKQKAETTFYRNLDFTIDTTRFDAQLVRETLNFTRDSFYINPNIDFSVTQILAPTDTTDSGSVITPRAKVMNLGNTSASGNLEMKIGPDYTDTASFSDIRAGDSAFVDFSSWTPTIPGNYAVSCSSMVAGDGNSGNDVKHDSTVVLGTGIEENYEQPVKPFDRMPTVLTQAQYRILAQKNGWKAFSPIGSKIGADYVGPAYIRDEKNKLRKVILLDGNKN